MFSRDTKKYIATDSYTFKYDPKKTSITIKMKSIALTGTILGSNGKPIGGSSIYIKDAKTKKYVTYAYSDEDGFYAFPNVFKDGTTYILEGYEPYQSKDADTKQYSFTYKKTLKELPVLKYKKELLLDKY